jgi:hypothetical protein
MNRANWQLSLGIILISLSAFVYIIHFFIFRDIHHIFIYLVGDIAFVFFEVLLVTIVIHNLLERKEKRERLEKLNMLIGVFFSEVGTDLLTYLSDHDPSVPKLQKYLQVTQEWSDKQFINVSKQLKSYSYTIESKTIKLEKLRALLRKKSDFLLRLLENPNLLEHESFTELLRAVFHLTEELVRRKTLTNLSKKDSEHLAGDIKRVYIALVREWLTTCSI